jgi:hypothetical protein
MLLAVVSPLAVDNSCSLKQKKDKLLMTFGCVAPLWKNFVRKENKIKMSSILGN